MKASFTTTSCFGVVSAGLILVSGFHTEIPNDKSQYELTVDPDMLKKEAFKILDMKCNVCHRKQNPFMVFKEKNMSKRARKIYKMVFVEQRMPKGTEVRLTREEYNQLEKWLKTQKIH